MKPRITFLVALSSFFLLKPAPGLAIDAGVARVDVTPSEPIRLTGYGNRKTNNVGIEQKLWAKALALGSDREGPALLLTLDNCGIAEPTYRELIARLTKKTRLEQAGIAIACSHTHSGPCTTDWAPNIFSSDISPPQQAVIDRYTKELIGKLEEVALAALKDRRPAQLSWSQGQVGFARNRRVVAGNTARFGDNAAGPVDHALPVLKITDPDGKLRALVANYACHCTTLGGEFNHVCGDWAGYAQEAIEREHSGATALITIGCGADANPFPRGGQDGGLALAKQHGEELAAEVKRLLGLTFTPLTNKLTSRLKEIRLPFGTHFTRDQLLARATNSGAVGYNSRKWLARLDRGEKLPESLYYPINTWRFGDELAMVFLPGEVVVDYALRLKRELDAQRLWVTAYANYVPCYIPSRRILAEGGYEAEDSLWYYDRPTRISTNAEELIIKTVHELLPRSFLSDPKKAEFPDPKTPQQALGTIRTKAGFTVELVASEPLIESPVAIDWDARGRLWVCEMYDYPTGLKPPPEQERKWGEPIKEPPGGFTPGGRIKILESTKHDGHYDKATLFLDKLAFPTGVFPWRNGALICAAPDILFAEDTDGDGRADVVHTNYTGFATHNYQARVNGFRWGLDGWLHGSSGLFGGKIKSLLTGKEVDLGGRDFRIRPDTGEIEPLAGISQMGRVRDDFDNWFGNDNSTLLWHYPLPEHYMRRNPYVTYPDPRVNVAAIGSRAVSGKVSEPVSGRPETGASASHSPAHRLTHSPDPNLLHPISRTLERFNHPESANRVTSACGPDIYRDVLLGPEYYGNAFICEPVHNLVTRLVLEPDGVTFAGGRADDEQRSEFLASTDNWFRPVQVRTGPDGALWVVDMYRFVIEHPRWIAPDRLKTLDARAGADMGRVYRVFPKGAKLRPIRDLMKLNDKELVEALGTPNGTTRDLIHAAQLRNSTREVVPKENLAKSLPDIAALPLNLRDARDKTFHTTLPVLCLLATNFANPAVRAQAATLLGFPLLPKSQTALFLERDPHPEVRRQIVRLAEVDEPGFMLGWPPAILSLTNDPDPRVRFQLALSLGSGRAQRWGIDPQAADTLAQLARSRDRWIRAAVLSSTSKGPAGILSKLLVEATDTDIVRELGEQLVRVAFAVDDTVGLSAAIEQLPRSRPPMRGWPEPSHAALVAGFLEATASKGMPWQDFFQTNSPAVTLGSITARKEAMKAISRLEQYLAETREVLNSESTLWAKTNQVSEYALGCVRLLGHEPAKIETDVEHLCQWLEFPAVAQAPKPFLDVLSKLRAPSVAPEMLDRWERYSPRLREQLINLLLTREPWTTNLLNAVHRGTVGVTEIGLAQRQRLLKHASPLVRSNAAALFNRSEASRRSEVLAKYESLSSLSSSSDRGTTLFDTHCAQCHAYRGHGHAVGPNLGEFVGKSVGDFVQAILLPNSAINPNFLAYNVETKDGRSLSGIVRGETASGLTLVQGGGLLETILRTDIQEIRASNLSLMPEGLEQAMTPQDLADLIAWIKQAAPAPFGYASANPDLAAKNRAEFLKSGASIVAKVTTLTETLPYRSWIGTLPMVYCRQSAGANRLAWESERPLTPSEGALIVGRDALPRVQADRQVGPTTEGERENRGAGGVRMVVFRFPAAMGFLSQPSGKFTLKVNGTVLFDFNVSLADESWQSPDGRARMSYAVTEANAEDSCGVLRIELAADLVKPGEPARFEVIGSDSGSQRWLGIYELNGKR